MVEEESDEAEGATEETQRPPNSLLSSSQDRKNFDGAKTKRSDNSNEFMETSLPPLISKGIGLL